MIIKNIQHFSDIDTIKETECFLDEYEINPNLGDDRIILYGIMYRLRGTNYLIGEGTYYNYNEETGEREPDFGVSLLFESTHGLNLDSPMYWEQGTPQMMFHNYVVMSVNNSDSSAVLLEACVA